MTTTAIITIVSSVISIIAVLPISWPSFIVATRFSAMKAAAIMTTTVVVGTTMCYYMYTTWPTFTMYMTMAGAVVNIVSVLVYYYKGYHRIVAQHVYTLHHRAE